eukprot:6173350-Pleurochrysis_carterae.AAC.3
MKKSTKRRWTESWPVVMVKTREPQFEKTREYQFKKTREPQFEKPFCCELETDDNRAKHKTALAGAPAPTKVS